MNIGYADRVTNILEGIGISANLKGFQCLRLAVVTACDNYKAVQGNITKFLYPKVADSFGMTPKCVERAIRHAIALAWKSKDADTLKEYFGNLALAGKKPTSGQFVLTLADRLLREDGIYPAM